MLTYIHCLLHIWQFPDLLFFLNYYLPEVHVLVTEQSAMINLSRLAESMNFIYMWFIQLCTYDNHIELTQILNI